MNSNALKKTILFLSGQTITLFGSALVQFAISWHITLTTKSGLMLTAATICGFLPQVIISLFAGVWADRFDKKRLIIIADSMIAVSTAVLALLFAFGYDKIWLLFVISAIRSLGSGVQTPAVGAFLPEIVPQEQLMRVNGINASIQGCMMLVSPVVAGGLYSFMGLTAIFWVDVLTAVIGISLLLMIKTVKAEAAAQEHQHVFRDMLGGISYVRKTKWLAQLLGFFLVFSLMFGPVVFLTPLMVARSFGDEPWRLVVHEVVFAAGMTTGGLLVGIFAQKIRNKIWMVIVSSAVFGLITVTLGLSPNFWFYLGIMLLMGVSAPFINTGSMTALQTRVQPDFMGRVFSLISIIGSTAMPLSMAIFGPISDSVSIETLLIVTGALMIAISLCVTRFKEMLAAGEPIE